MENNTWKILPLTFFPLNNNVVDYTRNSQTPGGNFGWVSDSPPGQLYAFRSILVQSLYMADLGTDSIQDVTAFTVAVWFKLNTDAPSMIVSKQVW